MRPATTAPAANPVASRQVGGPDGNLLLDLFVVHQRVGELLDVALSGTDLRPAEYAVLSQLDSGSLTPGDLRARLGTTKSTLSGHLGSLERLGHLHRRPHRGDARSHLLELTTSGRHTLQGCRAKFADALVAFESGLKHDPATARTMLVEIDSALARAIVGRSPGADDRR